ncbi:hypothetical protein FE392_19100 [Xenorhabdus sp. 12]|uniref:Anti-bacteriophage protein A/HamA C-terminal domain-containing protein n=1 Tax=Xenorhabdus santafensis TaxID=2582833 RepID=A0ABU4SEZ6_9GAMM|nr:hypothetical protein [Xenorhabdus sp. 12]MDX7989376.1 hypothetical protein [Xenorhabdus sp. 12]
MLPSEIKKLTSTHELHVIDIIEIDNIIEYQLDSFLVSICEGDSDSELTAVKRRLKQFLDTKSEQIKMGAVAELFVHLYLGGKDYKQEFLFFNLEEGSIKKGFDGYFSKSDETYILESKSGYIDSINVTHKSKLQEAYNDLEKYVSGKSDKSKNNPWRNAYNHACHIDVGASKTVRKKLKSLSDLFDKDDFRDISEFNIIPCSTIFLNGSPNMALSTKILRENSFIVSFKGKTVTSLCVTKRSLRNFLDYLDK